MDTVTAITPASAGSASAASAAGTGARPVLSVVAGAATVVVRPARPSDLPAIEAMFERCSDDTRYRRFHGVVGAAAHRELHRVAHPTATHRSWVAVARAGIRGVVTLAQGPDGAWEIAFLVEDDWFRHGVGRALGRAVVEAAAELGIGRLVAYVQPENLRARAFFRSIAPAATAHFEDRDVVLDIPLATPLTRSQASGTTADGLTAGAAGG